MLDWVLQLRAAQFAAIITIIPIVLIRIGLRLLLFLLRLLLLLNILIINILDQLPTLFALLLQEEEFLLVGLNLLGHFLADLYPFLEVFQHAALIEKEF